ncbi:MAG: hydroxymethylglutaryl-CoA reductase, degradative [Methanobacteriota archaeon]|nr:MAG: hydroxymethylglutaryl-CoA reductase, degradative [Euryarchaeota archaeon]
MSEKFYKKSVSERREIIKKRFGQEVVDKLNGLSVEKASNITENVIGVGSLPIGVVRNLVLNNKKYEAVPMMIEEPSVIAGANKACKLSLPQGFEAWRIGNEMIGEISLKVKDSREAKKKLEEADVAINTMGKGAAARLEKYGGGWIGYFVENYTTSRGEYVVVKFLVDVGNAMGANAINTIAEGMAPLLENITDGKAVLRILSNFSVYRKVGVRAEFKIDEKEREQFLDAFEPSKYDLYRTVTNNKGFMNGVDAVALATGQDWRAIEAAINTYAIVNGNKPIAEFYEGENGVVGYVEVPLAAGIVGGATKVLPHAQASLEMLEVKKAEELAMIMAAIGLANNFAATYALATTGIQEGHMKLHSRTLAISLGATEEEADKIVEMAKPPISMTTVKEMLEKIRKG